MIDNANLRVNSKVSNFSDNTNINERITGKYFNTDRKKKYKNDLTCQN